MRLSEQRLQKYLNEVLQCARKVEQIISGTEDLQEKDILALKYLVIEVAEAMANTLQHILAKEFGLSVKGYVDTILKADDKGVISHELFLRIKPFFDFRNALIHRYWKIDDKLFLKNLKEGYRDFLRFIEEIEEGFLKKNS